MNGERKLSFDVMDQLGELLRIELQADGPAKAAVK